MLVRYVLVFTFMPLLHPLLTYNRSKFHTKLIPAIEKKHENEQKNERTSFLSGSGRCGVIVLAAATRTVEFTRQRSVPQHKHLSLGFLLRVVRVACFTAARADAPSVAPAADAPIAIYVAATECMCCTAGLPSPQHCQALL